MAVAVVGVAMVLDMFIRADLGSIIFSPFFVGPVVVVGYLASPWLRKVIPLAPWRK